VRTCTISGEVVGEGCIDYPFIVNLRLVSAHEGISSTDFISVVSLGKLAGLPAFDEVLLGRALEI
jgi:hypothetical protein